MLQSYLNLQNSPAASIIAEPLHLNKVSVTELAIHNIHLKVTERPVTVQQRVNLVQADIILMG